MWTRWSPPGRPYGYNLSEGENGSRTTAVIVGNLMANNVSDKYDGYAGAVLLGHKTSTEVVNNTIINNFNYREDNGGTWETFYFRGYARAICVNNILVNNWENQRGSGKDAWRQERGFICRGNQALFYNLMENAPTSSWTDEDDPKEGNVIVDNDFDTKSILKNPDIVYPGSYNKLSDFIGGNYAPIGQVVDMGTLATDLKYWAFADKDNVVSLNVKETLEKYGTDFNGNPLVKDGKVSAGCFAK